MLNGLTLLLILALQACNYSVAQTSPAIGLWREHLPYGSAINLEAGSTGVFTATPYSIFHYNTSSAEISRYSKATGLSETGVSTIKYYDLASQLIIAYTNSNIDILEPGKVTNIVDIKLKNITGDKGIYNIYVANKLAYFSTGFGIVVLDLERKEIKDTWIIGNNGQQLKIDAVAILAPFIYAATPEGLKRANLNSDLRNFTNWQLISGTHGLATGIVRSVISFNDKIIALNNDSLVILNGSLWSTFYRTSSTISSITVSQGKLLVSERSSSSPGRLVVLKMDGSVENSIQNNILQKPVDAVIFQNNFFIADEFSGLLKVNGTSSERIIPNSPFEKASGEMIFHKGKLLVAAGEVNNAWNYTYNRFGLYIFQNNSWNNFNQYTNALLDTVLDVITVAGDPRNEDFYYGSYSGGLVKLSPGNRFSIYKQNSVIGPAVGDPQSYRVSGLAFDKENNLWISNYGAVNNLLVKKADDSWKAFTIPFGLSENAVSQLTIDEAGHKWIVSPKGNGLICFDHGTSIDNTNDDRWKYFRFGTGNGNLPDNEVYCTVKDKNGLIWIGTSHGVGIIPCAEQPFVNSCQAIQPVVKQGNFAGPLFATEEVRAIAVDGANRKWIGSKNGLWLISEDGETVINHFTEDNSPLLSNNVLRIAIDPDNGEVFLATAKGICSFRGTATEPRDNTADVLVFPNPVPPGYNGSIAIRGLSANSSIKITELNGRLVYETRSLGGQAIWNGKDYKGRQISTGAYLVFATAEDGKDILVTKIFIIK